MDKDGSCYVAMHRSTSLLSIIIDITCFVLRPCGMYAFESQCLVLLSHSNISAVK